MYRVTARIKDAESKCFVIFYDKYVDLNSDPHFKTVGSAENNTYTIYTLSLNILGVVHERFTD